MYWSVSIEVIVHLRIRCPRLNLWCQITKCVVLSSPSPTRGPPDLTSGVFSVLNDGGELDHVRLGHLGERLFDDAIEHLHYFI